jgi:hypothetical protein
VPRWGVGRLVTGRTAVAAVLVLALVSFWFFRFGPAGAVRLYSSDDRLIDERFGYTAQSAYAELDILGPAGRDAYHTFLLTDLAYPVVYAPALSLLLAYLARRLAPDRPALQWVAVAPFVGGLADWLENAGLLLVLSRYPDRLDGLVGLLSLMTITKLLVLQGCFLVVPLGFLALAVRELRR